MILIIINTVNLSHLCQNPNTGTWSDLLSTVHHSISDCIYIKNSFLSYLYPFMHLRPRKAAQLPGCVTEQREP